MVLVTKQNHHLQKSNRASLSSLYLISIASAKHFAKVPSTSSSSLQKLITMSLSLWDCERICIQHTHSNLILQAIYDTHRKCRVTPCTLCMKYVSRVQLQQQKQQQCQQLISISILWCVWPYIEGVPWCYELDTMLYGESV